MNFLYLLLLLLSLLLNETQANEVPINKKLNVLFIGADDLRMNLGVYGDPLAITPNIDELAAQSVRFNKAYVQFASCNASRASMLTGMYPDSLKVWRLNTPFRKTAPEVITLPQHLKDNGYHTESIGKVYHNYGNIGDVKSWSVPARLAQESHFTDYVLPSSLEKGAKKGIAAESAEYTGNIYVDDKITQDAIETIHRLKNNEQPFFLAVGFMKPHSPYNAPKKYWDLYQREKMNALGEEERPENTPKLNWFNYKEIRGLTDLPKKGKFSQETAQRLRHGYYAATSYLDDNLGQIIQSLKDSGQYDNTVIVFWSDHGYHLGENGHWTKATVRELDTRVPLLFRIPKQAPFVSDAIVEYTDIYPTLVDITNLTAPHNIDGVSFKKLFSSDDYHHRKVALSQAARPWPSNKPIKQMAYSIRTKNYRYTRWLNVNSNKIIAEELYHSEQDPLEVDNLIHKVKPIELEKIRKVYDEHSHL